VFSNSQLIKHLELIGKYKVILLMLHRGILPHNSVVCHFPWDEEKLIHRPSNSNRQRYFLSEKVTKEIWRNRNTRLACGVWPVCAVFFGMCVAKHR
jgi:hypothetical protein